jgi:Thiolase C-terminal domain-like
MFECSIYDSFTITVLITLEDLGFCPKGQGGKLVADGNLISGVGRLPFNTDGGGLCNNHPPVPCSMSACGEPPPARASSHYSSEASRKEALSESAFPTAISLGAP